MVFFHLDKKLYYASDTVRAKGGSDIISFDQFVMEDGVPIYIQILQYIKRSIVTGTIQNGDELPSHRFLSALLGVNPNTIQKAYRMLEEEGLLQSHSGGKSVMALDEEKISNVRKALLENDARSVVNAMRQMRLRKEEALELIERYWE